MEIEIGSKWVKIGDSIDVYEVLNKEEIRILHNGIGVGREVIAYETPFGEIRVRTEKEFLASFKPVLPTYEYQWAYVTKQPASSARLTIFMDEEQFASWESSYNEELEYQRLDFTKRERK